ERNSFGAIKIAALSTTATDISAAKLFMPSGIALMISLQAACISLPFRAPASCSEASFAISCVSLSDGGGILGSLVIGQSFVSGGSPGPWAEDSSCPDDQRSLP